MNIQSQTSDSYRGFEQGPIRPPSEARSLLIRFTRNCPWNRCTFCRTYKGLKFSIRKKEHVKRDIDSVHRYVEILKQMAAESGHISRLEVNRAAENIEAGESQAFVAAYNWMAGGMKSIFIQDANSLIMKPLDLVEIVTYLKDKFYWVERITSYARSHTVARIKDKDLKAIMAAGLNRIHIGLESGSDIVLEKVMKGVTKEIHIKAGKKVKNAGIELSEYVIPGLGGKEHSKVHALETSDALNQINPDFIRLRSLAIPKTIELYQEYKEGRFEKCTDLMVTKEIMTFIENLNGITSVVKSDHILNLFEDVEGTLPGDQEHMLDVLREFLAMEPERRCLYQVGRRLGFFSRISDMESPNRLERVEKACERIGVTPENVDEITDEIIKNFI